MSTIPDVTLRKEQLDAVTRAVKFLKRAKPGRRLLFGSATGTGKSYVELEILSRVPGGVLLSPSLDIIAGHLAKLGHKITDAMSDDTIRKTAAAHSIYTPIYFRNRLVAGDMEPPAYILWDEAHHHNSESWGDVSLLCDCPEVGFTATPYRGTMKGTLDFRAVWGEVHWIYDYPTAVAKGFVSLPETFTVPLLDDDIIEVDRGEFQVKSVEAATRSRFIEASRLINETPLDRATMICCPTVATAQELAELIDDAVVVTGDTSRADRLRAYHDLTHCRKKLIQVAVVGEGVDLPVRRIIDLSPTMSPVVFVQRFGRLTRPGGESIYIATNRNLLRHAYALQGVIPAAEVAQSQAVLGLGTRNGSRVFGLEGLGRFKANPLPLRSGMSGELYLLENSDKKGTIKQFACVLHPLHAEPLWATRTNVTGTYGDWTLVDAPQGFVGFASGNGSAVTEKQMAWWKKSAAKYGLDPEHKPNRRTFAALPVLSQLGLVMEN